MYISIYSINGPEQRAITCDKLERLGHELVFIVCHDVKRLSKNRFWCKAVVAVGGEYT